MPYDPNALTIAKPPAYGDVPDPNGQGLPLAKPRSAQQPSQIGQPPNTPSYAGSITPLDTRPTDLLAKTIGPDQTPDRVGLATKAWETFAKASDPYYQKSIRDIGGVEAAKGRIGSGQYRTSLGDAANNRQIQLDTARDTLLNNALTGSIDDAYKNVGIAQQQQGFQAGQQESAYGQALGKAQQQLAEEIGKSNIGVQRGQLQLAKSGQEGAQALQAGELTGTYGGTQTLGARAQTLAEQATGASLGLEHEKLQLAKTGQEAQIGQTQQQIDLAKKQADVEAAYKNGTLTLAQRNQQLAELQNTQQFGQEGEKLALAKTGQEAQIGLEKEKLALAKSGQEQAGSQFAQSLEFQKQQADIEAQYKAGTLTLAQRNQALAELQNSQQNTLETGKLALATTGQAADTTAKQRALDIQQQSQDLASRIQGGQLSIAQAAEALDEKVKTGQLTLAERDQTLKELQNKQGFDFKMADETGQITSGHDANGYPIVEDTLAKRQLNQLAAQFGLSQQQQRALAEMVDRTQNRELDLTSAQGQNQLLVQLTQILGGSTGLQANPSFLLSVLGALGYTFQNGVITPTGGGGGGGRQGGTGGGGGGGAGSGGGT